MNRRQLLVGAGLSTAGALAVGTGAFSAARVDREATFAVTNDADGLVGLVANPQVAGVHEDDHGALTIDLAATGVNVESIYQFGQFTEDWEAAEVPDIFPKTAEEPATMDENGSFGSAFLVRNQTTSPKHVRMSFDVNEEASEPGETRFLFQTHYDGAQVDTIVFENDDDPTMDVTVEALEPAEAFGVSFIVDALEGAVEDTASGSITTRVDNAGQ